MRLFRVTIWKKVGRVVTCFMCSFLLKENIRRFGVHLRKSKSKGPNNLQPAHTAESCHFICRVGLHEARVLFV